MKRLFLPVFLVVMTGAIFLSERFFTSEGPVVNRAVSESSSIDDRDYPAWMDEFIDPPTSVEAKKIYTFTCEFPTRKPDVFTTACADFGEMVREITWEEWNIVRPTGEAIYSLNDCRPSCAEGTRSEIPIRVWLEDVTSDGEFYFFNTLKIVPLEAFEGSNRYAKSQDYWLYNDVEFEGKTYQGATWDLSSDWKMFPEMREELPD